MKPKLRYIGAFECIDSKYRWAILDYSQFTTAELIAIPVWLFAIKIGIFHA